MKTEGTYREAEGTTPETTARPEVGKTKNETKKEKKEESPHFFFNYQHITRTHALPCLHSVNLFRNFSYFVAPNPYD